MCFDHDSRPPIAPIAGGALDGSLVTLTAEDGTAFAAFRARPDQPTGAGVVILPDVRGLHPFYEELALRFAEHGVDALAIDWFGRTAGVARRDADFEYMPHVAATTWDGIAADIAAAVGALRADGVERVFTMGFCMGGRMAFLSAALGLDLAGVIGLYGTLVGPWRNDAPEPVVQAGRMTGRVLGLFGGADTAIPAEHIADVRGRPDGGRRRAPAGHLRGRAAQLLRSQGGRLRRGQRGRLGRDPGLRRRPEVSAWRGSRRRRPPAGR